MKTKSKVLANQPKAKTAPAIAGNDTPQVAPVAVLTITYSPPLKQVVSIAPHFPQKMPAEDVLFILRETEAWLIGQMAIAKAQADAQQNEAGKVSQTS